MNKTKQLYKLFESFRFFLFLLNCMKYSTNIFSLGYLISEVLQLNVCNNRTCTKVFILILFPFSMPIFSDKEHLIFQKEISSLFSSACCNLSLPVLEVDFIFSFSLLHFPHLDLKSEETRQRKIKFKVITLKKKLDNYFVLCCYFLNPFPTPAQLCRLLRSPLFLVTPRMFRGVMRSIFGSWYLFLFK